MYTPSGAWSVTCNVAQHPGDPEPGGGRRRVVPHPPSPILHHHDSTQDDDDEGEQTQQQQLEPIKEEEEEEDPQPDLTISQISTTTDAITDQQKLSLLKHHTFRFLPVSPKTLDLSPHEPLLRSLGLWDFANLDLSADIRTDLLVRLIASYDPSLHRSFLSDDAPVSVSRSSLAESLSLPLGNDVGLSPNAPAPAAVEEFIMVNYFILAGDTNALPDEAATARRMVEEGRAREVDWAGLMWALVEKDIMEPPLSGRFLYGPHLQRLIQCQRPDLFEERTDSATVPDSDWSTQVSDDEVEVEECGTGLSLGLGEKDAGFEHCLRRCGSVGAEKGVEFENLCGVEDGEDFPNLERLTSTDLLHGMETVNVSCSPQMNPLEQSNGDFLTTTVDTNKNMDMEPGPGDFLLFGNNGKRHVQDVDIDDDNDPLKRMRTGGLWGEQMLLNFDSFMEQIQCTVGRAKMLYDEKDQACMNAQMEIQYLTELLEEKDQIIQTLEKTRVDSQQKWQQTVCSYESELNIVADLMLGYKRALKQVQMNFAEYRKKFPQGDELLYKDVPGSGGLVLSVREFERNRLEKELEMRRIAEEMVNDFLQPWSVKFEDFAGRLLMLQEKLVGLDEELDLLKKRFAKTKIQILD